jgi:hypothetical protein
MTVMTSQIEGTRGQVGTVTRGEAGRDIIHSCYVSYDSRAY